MRGEPSLSPDYFIGGYNQGLAIRIPVLDIVEVGTGGGSVAWLDEGHALHVGPRSAGADPGPAAYGRGGAEPTVTDANVVLGRLAPDAFLGGEMRLDREAAAHALRLRLAEKLDVDLERAASGMLEVATSSMANVVRQVTLQRGLDPRDFTLFAYGGGGPLHASAVARELSIGTVIVPQAPGLFSALGMLLADVRRDYVQTLFVRLDSVEMPELEAQYRRLEDEGRAALEASGIATDDVAFERAADMRYVGQEHAVSVRMPASVALEDARGEMKRRFDAAHQQHYSHSASAEPADVVSLRVTAIGRLAKPALREIDHGGMLPAAAARTADRSVTFDGHGPVSTAVYDRARLLEGNVIEGPAVIEEDASTTLVSPRDVATINRYGHIVLRIG
jgi:N-methylhydantoinase A